MADCGKIHDVEPNSAAWRAARLGKVTASRIADMVAKTKTGWGASRKNYRAELVVERLTGVPTEGFVSAAMQYGLDTEPEARSAYEFMTGNRVRPAGFVDHPRLPQCGCSPDGWADAGLIEVKCPQPATHIETLLRGAPDPSYVKQMQFQMACTGTPWCDFVSYHPGFPASMQLFIARLPRDDAAIAELEAEVPPFLDEVEAVISALRHHYEGGPSPLRQMLQASITERSLTT